MSAKNETVLITGSSRGLGEQLALVFAENGYNILLNGRNRMNMKKVREKVLEKGVACDIAEGDLRIEQAIEEVARIAAESDVSVLVNNAGISMIHDDEEEDLALPLYKVSDKQIDNIIFTNLLAPIKLTMRIYGYFLKKGKGTIMNINSLAEMELQELKSIYCASKWGLRGFTDTLRLEASKQGIRVMGVYPSRIKTKKTFTYGMEPREAAEKIYQAFTDAGISEFVLDGRPKK